jgi:magnesium transporter
VTQLAAAAEPVTASIIRASLLHDRAVMQGGLELLGDWSEQSGDCIWIDVTGPQRNDIEPLLEEWFRFHELAAEDALSPTTLPKFDAFQRYDFFVFRTISLDVTKHNVRSEKMSCFLGKNFVVTIHKDPLEAADVVWNRIPLDTRIMARGVDFLLYAILDFLVDQHFPLIEEIEERLDEIHEMIFASPSQALLDELLDFKRDLNVLRRQSLPQRELFNQISRGEANYIKREHLIYFRDLYDHMYRIGEFVADERDMATTTMEAYLSVIANRTNEIMKVLTIFSSIMLPINFIASIYGMNFEFMPELKWRLGYAWALGLMSLVATGMLVWFWTRGWLLPRRRDVIRHERKVKKILRRRHLPENAV